MSDNYENDCLFGGSGLTLIVLMLFFLTIGGNGMFGGWGGNSAIQGAMTRAELYEGLNSQNTFSEFRSIQNEVTNGFTRTNDNLAAGFNGIQRDIACGVNGIQSSLCQGFAGINAGIADLGYKMQDCCCELKTVAHAEAEATRALIQQNTIQELRDRLQDEKNERLATGLVTANTIQTNNLENFIRSYSSGCGC